MDLLPCGHISHSESEERYWASPEFEALVKRQKKLCEGLFHELKKTGKLNLGPFPPVPYTYETLRIYETKQHFDLLKKRLPRPKYLKQVAVYERAHRAHFNLPPCQRGGGLSGETLPLIPAQVPGLLQPSDLPTPRTGGRRPSRGVLERNARIAELKRAGQSHRQICSILDQEHYAVPASWRKQGVQTWRQGYARIQDRVHSLISKASTKKLPLLL
jgi:hypothetical protein